MTDLLRRRAVFACFYRVIELGSLGVVLGAVCGLDGHGDGGVSGVIWLNLVAQLFDSVHRSIDLMRCNGGMGE